MNIQELATKARNSISNFCMSECNAYCCRKGYLVLSEVELDFLVGEKRSYLESEGDIKKLENNSFSLHLGNSLGACPRLDGAICSVYKDALRPLTCEKFPLFVDEEKKMARFSSRCFAVKENKMYPYREEFLRRGFKVNEI